MVYHDANKLLVSTSSPTPDRISVPIQAANLVSEVLGGPKNVLGTYGTCIRRLMPLYYAILKVAQRPSPGGTTGSDTRSSIQKRGEIFYKMPPKAVDNKTLYQQDKYSLSSQWPRCTESGGRMVSPGSKLSLPRSLSPFASFSMCKSRYWFILGLEEFRESLRSNQKATGEKWLPPPDWRIHVGSYTLGIV